MKWENIEIDGKNTDREHLHRVTRQLIQHITEAKKAISQTKYKTLPHAEDAVEMAKIRNEIHQLNKQIEVMGYNRWQFQELHRLRQELKQLAQEESTVK